MIRVKNILLCLSLCLLLSACDQIRTHQPSDAPVIYDQLRAEKNYWDSIPGKLKVRDKYRPYRYYLNNDLYTGGIRDTTPSGRLKLVGSFKEGYAEGPWTYYHLNGTLDQVGSFEQGYVTGLWKFYDNRGEENARLFYKRDKRNIITDTLMVVNKDCIRKEWVKDSTYTYYADGSLRSRETNDGSAAKWWDRHGAVMAEMKDYVKHNKQNNEKTFYVYQQKNKIAYEALLKAYPWDDREKRGFPFANVVTLTPDPHPIEPWLLDGVKNVYTVRTEFSRGFNVDSIR